MAPLFPPQSPSTPLRFSGKKPQASTPTLDLKTRINQQGNASLNLVRHKMEVDAVSPAKRWFKRLGQVTLFAASLLTTAASIRVLAGGRKSPPQPPDLTAEAWKRREDLYGAVCRKVSDIGIECVGDPKPEVIQGRAVLMETEDTPEFKRNFLINYADNLTPENPAIALDKLEREATPKVGFLDTASKRGEGAALFGLLSILVLAGGITLSGSLMGKMRKAEKQARNRFKIRKPRPDQQAQLDNLQKACQQTAKTLQGRLIEASYHSPYQNLVPHNINVYDLLTLIAATFISQKAGKTPYALTLDFDPVELETTKLAIARLALQTGQLFNLLTPKDNREGSPLVFQQEALGAMVDLSIAEVLEHMVNIAQVQNKESTLAQRQDQLLQLKQEAELESVLTNTPSKWTTQLQAKYQKLSRQQEATQKEKETLIAQLSQPANLPPSALAHLRPAPDGTFEDRLLTTLSELEVEELLEAEPTDANTGLPPHVTQNTARHTKPEPATHLDQHASPKELELQEELENYLDTQEERLTK